MAGPQSTLTLAKWDRIWNEQEEEAEDEDLQKKWGMVIYKYSYRTFDKFVFNHTVEINHLQILIGGRFSPSIIVNNLALTPPQIRPPPVILLHVCRMQDTHH